jgi:hypothetical protein
LIPSSHAGIPSGFNPSTGRSQVTNVLSIIL